MKKQGLYWERNVLFTVYIGEERSVGDDMDSSSSGEEAPKESGGGYRHWCLCWLVLFNFILLYSLKSQSSNFKSIYLLFVLVLIYSLPLNGAISKSS